MKKRIVGAILPIAALWSGHSLAQTGAPVNDTDYLSKETENPVTRKITVPLRYEADFLDGADKLTKSTIELDQASLGQDRMRAGSWCRQRARCPRELAH